MSSPVYPSQSMSLVSAVPIAIAGPVPVTAATPLDVVPSVNKAATATITVSPTITNTSVLIKAANVNRVGLVLYNNSANSVYVALGSAANSGNNMTFIIATFAHLVLPTPIYTGPIYGIRNGAGTGTVIVTELT